MNHLYILPNKYFRKSKLAAILLFAILTTISCQKDIHWTVKEGQTRLMVEAMVTNENTYQQVRLSQTSSYYEKEEPIPVSNAYITVTDGTNTYKYVEIHPKSGVYKTETKFAGIIGNEYKLNIHLVEQIGKVTEVEAKEKMLQAFNLDSVTAEVNYSNNPYSEDSTIFIRGWGQEPAEEGNYYFFRYYVNNILGSDTLNKTGFTDDIAVNGKYLSPPINGMISISFNSLPTIHENDTLMVETYSISKQFFEYINNALNEKAKADDILGFSGMPANVLGNLNNGVMGYFCVAPVSAKKCIFRHHNKKY